MNDKAVQEFNETYKYLELSLWTKYKFKNDER